MRMEGSLPDRKQRTEFKTNLRDLHTAYLSLSKLMRTHIVYNSTEFLLKIEPIPHSLYSPLSFK